MSNPLSQMQGFSPCTMFPDFYTNPIIRLLADATRWSISGRLGADDTATHKAPIDIRHLIDGCTPFCQHTAPVRGAYEISPECLVTLGELTAEIPAATNTAFRLRTATDGFVVIDIEPQCPSHVAAQLLAIPEAGYIEYSMSGRGYHVLAPTPDNWRDHPIAARKSVLRHPHGWYEILIDHWVTFTRRTIAPNDLPALPEPDLRRPEFSSLATVWDDLVALTNADQPHATAHDIDFPLDLDDPEIPDADALIEGTIEAEQPVLKTPADFDHDMSRFEFSTLNLLFIRLRHQISQQRFFVDVEHDYTPAELAWLVFRAAERVLPPRAKHNETRNGRPFLLDRAVTAVALRLADEQTATRTDSEHTWQSPAQRPTDD